MELSRSKRQKEGNAARVCGEFVIFQVGEKAARGEERRWDRAGLRSHGWKTLGAQIHWRKVELIVGEAALSIFLHPLFSLCTLPMHTQIRFSYISSAAYHVIVETYAQWCADMCAGPGSTGRVRDTWCTAKLLLILLLLSFFFPSCFPLRLLSVVLFFSHLT